MFVCDVGTLQNFRPQPPSRSLKFTSGCHVCVHCNSCMHAALAPIGIRAHMTLSASCNSRSHAVLAVCNSHPDGPFAPGCPYEFAPACPFGDCGTSGALEFAAGCRIRVRCDSRLYAPFTPLTIPADMPLRARRNSCPDAAWAFVAAVTIPAYMLEPS